MASSGAESGNGIEVSGGSAPSQLGASALLRHGHVFGAKADLRNGLQFVEDSQLVYAAGNVAVLYASDSLQQTFFHD